MALLIGMQEEEIGFVTRASRSCPLLHTQPAELCPFVDLNFQQGTRTRVLCPAKVFQSALDQSSALG